jgi:hypothetical protein
MLNKIKNLARKLIFQNKIEDRPKMIKGDWGHEKRVWGIGKTYDSGRMIQIYEAIKDLEFNSLVDIACGQGIIADGLKWVFPNKEITQFDFWEYPEWVNLSVVPYREDVMDFIKKEKQYDVVLFLNSYRNWDEKEEFNKWLYGHARYFITSGENNIKREKKVIGVDAKGYKLELYKVK